MSIFKTNVNVKYQASLRSPLSRFYSRQISVFLLCGQEQGAQREESTRLTHTNNLLPPEHCSLIILTETGRPMERIHKTQKLKESTIALKYTPSGIHPPDTEVQRIYSCLGLAPSLNATTSSSFHDTWISFSAFCYAAPMQPHRYRKTYTPCESPTCA